MKKCLLSAVLALVLLLGSVPVLAFAEDLANDSKTAPAYKASETADASESATPLKSAATAKLAVATEPAGQAGHSFRSLTGSAAQYLNTNAALDGDTAACNVLGTYNAAPDVEPLNTTEDSAVLVVQSFPTSCEITYCQTLAESLLEGGSVVTKDGGVKVEGTFSWKDPSIKPDAGRPSYDVVFIPADSQYEAIDVGKIAINVCQAPVNFYWCYDIQSVNYIGSPVQVFPPILETPDGGTHTGEITYMYREYSSDEFFPGLPENAGTYYVSASITAAGNYLGKTTDKELKLLIQKRSAKLDVEDLVRPYNGQAVTLDDISKVAYDYFGQELTGSWAFSSDTPEIKEVGSNYVTVIFTPDNPNYALTSTTISIVIEEIDLTEADVTVAGSYTYNAAEQLPPDDAVTVTLNGDVIPASEYTISYSNNTNAGQAVVTVQGQNHYTGTAKGQFTIAPIPLTISAATVADRRYDETQKVDLTGLNLKGILEADRGKVQPQFESVTATVESADVGTYDAITLSGSFALEGSAKDNYILSGAGQKLTGNALNNGQGVTITPAVVEYVQPLVLDKIYDGTTDASVTDKIYSTSPQVSQSLPVTIDVAFVSSDVGNTKVQGTATMTSDNFVFSNGLKTTATEETSANITPRPVEIHWNSPFEYTYDGEKHSISADITNLVNDDNVELICINNSAVQVGQYCAEVQELDGPDKGNYTLEDVSGTLQIWQILPISLSNAEIILSETSYVYDGTEHTPDVTVKMNGNTLTEGEDYDLEFVHSTIDAGTVCVVASGLDCYTDEASTSYIIEPAPVTPIDAVLETKTYDGTVSAVVKSVTFDGVPSGQQFTMDTHYSASAEFDSAGAGADKTVTVSIDADKNYQNYQLTTDTLVLSNQTILKKAATVSVNLSPSDWIYRNEVLPTVSLTYTGLLNGESLAPAAVTVDGMPANSATFGTYPLSVSGDTRNAILALDAAQNYQITFEMATLTIRNDILVVPLNGDKQYRLGKSDLTSVPAELQALGFTTVESIKDTMYQVAVKVLPGVTAENTVLQDIMLLYSEDSGNTWIKATQDHFLPGGITVTLPYPEGTNAADYAFVVTHMATVTINGLSVGNVEVPAVTETNEGLQFTVKSLSPVTISWKLTATQESSTVTAPSSEAASNHAASSAYSSANELYPSKTAGTASSAASSSSSVAESSAASTAEPQTAPDEETASSAAPESAGQESGAGGLPILPILLIAVGVAVLVVIVILVIRRRFR